MGLFSKKPTGILGIDVGAGAVKMVELVREAGRARLRTYGFTERESIVAFDPREHIEEMGAIIRELRRQSGAVATTAIASLPTFSVFSSVITLPELPKKEIPAAIRWEVKKLIPLPLEEMILNWEPLPESLAGVSRRPTPTDAKTTGDIKKEDAVVIEKEKKSVSFLITAAQKKLVEQYVAIFKASGIALQSLETEAFALERSLVGNDKSTVMIVDIGARNTDISVIDCSIPVLNRSMDFGGKNFTETIVGITKLAQAHAEQLKRDISQSRDAVIPKAFEPILTPLLNEIQYTLSLYQSRSGGRIEKIILTGGSGLLFNLVTLLTSRFNITVVVGDPWARIATPIDLTPVLQEIGPRMSVAVGLAMRGI